jgi:hypothetical protein
MEQSFSEQNRADPKKDTTPQCKMLISGFPLLRGLPVYMRLQTRRARESIHEWRNNGIIHGRLPK